jgi:hypothetical protein
VAEFAGQGVGPRRWKKRMQAEGAHDAGLAGQGDDGWPFVVAGRGGQHAAQPMRPAAIQKRGGLAQNSGISQMRMTIVNGERGDHAGNITGAAGRRGGVIREDVMRNPPHIIEMIYCISV